MFGLQARGTILSRSDSLPSSQSTTPFLSVTLTNPTFNPFSLTCFIYSALPASRHSHAKYTASNVKKSAGCAAGSLLDTAGFLRRVGVDLGYGFEESTRCVAAFRDGVGLEDASVQVMVSFDFTACRSARRGSCWVDILDKGGIQSKLDCVPR